MDDLVMDCNDEIVCPHFASHSERAYLCHPLAALGDTSGLLYLSADSPHKFTPENLRLARTVAEHISLSLANLQLQESLRVQSIVDPVTGLFNRRYLESSLDREFARARRSGQPLAVLMCDLDHFKRFNDTQGREALCGMTAQFRRKALGAVTASFGLALFPDHGTTLAEITAAADAALYRAKHEGRNRLVVADRP